MTEIAGRWEWRTFGDDFGAAEERLAALEPERVQESDELYLLTAAEVDTVKVRDGLMDVKRLVQVSDDGLEQWLPAMKAGFPLPARDAAAACASLGLVEVTFARAEYSLDQLLDELLRPSGVVVFVQAHKERRRYTVDGCMAELADVSTDHGSTRTLALESEDHALVLATVRELGLASRRNVSYPDGLSSLAGLGSRRFAVIDVGTNSVKFHVGERRRDGEWRTVVDRADVTRLGEGLDATGSLGDEPMERTASAIAAMADEARQDGVEAIAVVGTAGMRIAANAPAFVASVRERSGVEIEVIPGEQEARLAYRAAVAGLGSVRGSLVVFDSGGGSSQFTFGDGEHVDEQFSVNVGAARFTDRFELDGAVSPEQLDEALAAIAADLASLDGRPAPDALVGMGGAVTNLAAVRLGLASYDADAVQGTVLDRAEIDRQVELYRTRSAEERRTIPGLQPNRAAVILAGACIVRTVLAKLGRDSFTVSDRGLRHALIVERFS